MNTHTHIEAGVDSVLGKALTGVSAFLNDFGSLITIALAFLLVTLIILFVYHATNLAKSGDNYQKRQQAMHGLFVVGICIALTGSFGLIYGLLLMFIVS